MTNQAERTWAWDQLAAGMRGLVTELERLRAGAGELEQQLEHLRQQLDTPEVGELMETTRLEEGLLSREEAEALVAQEAQAGEASPLGDVANYVGSSGGAGPVLVGAVKAPVPNIGWAGYALSPDGEQARFTMRADRNFMRYPEPAIALFNSLLGKAFMAGVKHIVVLETASKTIYSTAIGNFNDYGAEQQLGTYAPQTRLPMRYWTTYPYAGSVWEQEVLNGISG